MTRPISEQQLKILALTPQPMTAALIFGVNACAAVPRSKQTLQRTGLPLEKNFIGCLTWFFLVWILKFDTISCFVFFVGCFTESPGIAGSGYHSTRLFYMRDLRRSTDAAGAGHGLLPPLRYQALNSSVIYWYTITLSYSVIPNPSNRCSAQLLGNCQRLHNWIAYFITY